MYVIDNLSRGFRELVNKKAVFVKKDIRDIKFIKKIILEKNKYRNTSCALIDVQESEKFKKMYYENNIRNCNLRSMQRYICQNIIYSSSAEYMEKQKILLEKMTI